MLSFFKSRSLADRLNETKKIKIDGVIFRIKRLNPINYLDGSQAIRQIYDIYKVGDQKIDDRSMNKIKTHYRDVFMGCIVKPKLSRKKDGEGVFVDDIFEDWDLANSLYEEIIEYTYGKKKVFTLN